MEGDGFDFSAIMQWATAFWDDDSWEYWGDELRLEISEVIDDLASALGAVVHDHLLPHMLQGSEEANEVGHLSLIDCCFADVARRLQRACMTRRFYLAVSNTRQIILRPVWMNRLRYGRHFA